ncbi:hypothetical protein ACIO87_35850 [Streptomyces sp. NPDC087218]|uniref:hypothetical protein n=1 Tax=Streptomyces sp. NPDC087218 TaxID=3365769 RepID=UPI00380A7278
MSVPQHAGSPRTDPGREAGASRPNTSSRFHPLQRPKARKLLTYARPGDTVHISETFRLARGTDHILMAKDQPFSLIFS